MDSTGIVLILLNGYGMVIANDRMNHGYRLPKIIPGDVIAFGIKSTIVYGFFVCFQKIILSYASEMFGFPMFNLEGLLLNFEDTIGMFFTNTPEYMLMFLIIGGLLFYVTAVFAEIGLARLADTKSFFSAFDFIDIYSDIKLFGFGRYVRDYTTIIVAIVILLFIKSISFLDFFLDNLWEMIFGALIFATQYLGIGASYCEIKDAKIKLESFEN